MSNPEKKPINLSVAVGALRTLEDQRAKSFGRTLVIDGDKGDINSLKEAMVSQVVENPSKDKRPVLGSDMGDFDW